MAKYANLVLKRGFVSSQSELAIWCKAMLSNNLTTPIVPRNVRLSLLGADGAPLAAWTFWEAWPVKWRLGDFKVQENALAIETLELAFSNFQKV